MKKFIIFLLALINTYSLSQWQWLNPLPQGNKLNGSFALNDQLVFACGDHGTVIKTSDGGDNWELLNTPVSTHLLTIYFIDQYTGFAAGGNTNTSSIIKTTNGGASWVITDNSQFVTRSITFINNMTGFAAGGYLNQAKILKTTNGGNNWFALNHGVIRELHNVHFINENTGWSCGMNAMILKTTNSGLNWNVLTINNGYQIYKCLNFLNKDTGFAASTNGIYKTLDGGYNWSNIKSGGYFDVKFFDINNGITSGGSNPGSAVITTNGGINWTNKSTGYNISIISGAYHSMQKFWLFGWYGLIVKTTNNGDNFIFQTKGIYPFNSPTSINKMRFLNTTTGWCVIGTSTQSSVFKTTDYGTSWNNLFTFPGEIRSAHFPSVNTGYAAGARDPGKLYKTTDGGNNWEIVLSTLVSGLYDVYFMNDNTGFACGEYGSIYKTSNGGLNWSQTALGSPGTNSSIFIVNEQTIFIGGTHGVLKTTNAGVNWFVSIGSGEVYNLFFLNEQTGWACGINTYLVKTTNSGNSWTSQIVENSAGLNGIFFINKDTGFVGSVIGTLHKTSNGGMNWIPLGLKSSNGISTIHFINSMTGLISGMGNSIMKTTTGGLITGFNVDEKHQIPEQFLTISNYPNPFNPVTKIKFKIPYCISKDDNRVVVVIYDLLGHEVETLIDKKMNPGIYEVQWPDKDKNSSDYASGIYFCRITYGISSVVVKMLLLK
jgi:photosystem II stability/assembly factor-like uncharacterized protein